MLTLVVPSYNELNNLEILLPKLLDFIEDHDFRLILVDDGSKDKSANLLQAYSNIQRFKIIRHPVNKGYGGALKSGIIEAQTEYCITLDADGQHNLESVLALYSEIRTSDFDMIIGARTGQKRSIKSFGKYIIRLFAKLFLNIKDITDLNSGMKIYKTELVKKYLYLCPDSMAFSDAIVLVMLSQKHLIKEIPITIDNRKIGKSHIRLSTAFETFYEILNLIMLFNPIRIFFPASIAVVVSGILWGLPIILRNQGVSVGSALLILTGMLIFFLGLIAQQISQLRKENLNKSILNENKK